MNKTKNAQVWDELSEVFNTHKENMYQGAVDNIYTVWPVILGYAKKNFKKNKLYALDYGCGTGMFCKELKCLGFETYGTDISQKMIAVAKEHLKGKIEFFVGGPEIVLKLSEHMKFNLITSIMVFQFVKDIKKCIKTISNSLAKEGHIIFAVHNPKKLEERGVKGKFEIPDTRKTVPIFKRNAEDYDKIFRDLRFKKTVEKYPKTSKKFLEKYTQRDSLKIPKYMILGYKRMVQQK